VAAGGFRLSGPGDSDVPVYPTLTAEQTAFPARHARTRLAFVSTDQQRDKLESHAASLPDLRWIVVFEAGPEFAPSAAPPGIHRIRWAQWLAGPPMPEAQFASEIAARGPEHIATWLYTSGTTGVPKAVPLSHANLCANLAETTQAFPLSPRDRRLSVLPLSHITERHLAYLDIHTGMSTWFAESLDKIPDNLQEIRPTVLAAVPRMFEKIAASVRTQAAARPWPARRIFAWAQSVGRRQAPYRLGENSAPPPLRLRLAGWAAEKLIFARVRQRLGGRLRIAMAGGAALPREVAEFLLSLGWLVDQGYGMSETAPVIALSRPGARRLGSVGKPLANLQVRIGGDGEIQVRGSSVFAGYAGDSAPAPAFTPDGWFQTGDLGHFDSDGFLFVTGRKSELIKTSGGKFIAPQPIEDQLKSSPLIAEAMVVGEGRPYATVLLQPDFAVLESRARAAGWIWPDRERLCRLPQVQALYAAELARVNLNLARFETLKRFLLLAAEWSVAGGEITPTLKLRRSAIEARHRSQLDELYR
jgi:long-chain acyl-CoA synthetase